MLVVWAGLVGAGLPAFACASAAAAGDCCPPDAPSGCTQVYQQLDVQASICVTAEAPARMVERDHGSADPIVLVASGVSLPDPGSIVRVPVRPSSACTDASLTYLHTGRLRL